MRTAVFGAVAGFLAINSCARGFCQDNARPYLDYTESPGLYFQMPETESSGRVDLVASSAQRNLSYPLALSTADTRDILQLRGNVEVTMCPPANCENGSVVLHADAVDYNEKTGEMDVRGNVRIGPFQSRPAPPSR